VYLFAPDFFSPAVGQVRREKPLLFSEYYNLNLLSLGNTKYLVSPIPLHHKDLRLIHSPTDEQLAWKANPSRFYKVTNFLAGRSPGFALYVYENLLFMPRLSLVGKTMVFHDKNELLEALAKADHETLASHAFVLNSDVSTAPLHELGSEKGEVVIRDYSPDSITVATRCDSPAILVASNNWSPQWKVWVDGVETPLFPVYHTFQGLYCPSGHHEVVFRYVPPW